MLCRYLTSPNMAKVHFLNPHYCTQSWSSQRHLLHKLTQRITAKKPNKQKININSTKLTKTPHQIPPRIHTFWFKSHHSINLKKMKTTKTSKTNLKMKVWKPFNKFVILPKHSSTQMQDGNFLIIACKKPGKRKLVKLSIPTETSPVNHEMPTANTLPNSNLYSLHLKNSL